MIIDLRVPFRVIVRKEVGDPRFYGMHADSVFLHHVKKALQRRGYDCIKRLAWKDGHLVSDTMHYLRDRKYKWLCWDPNYAVRSIAKTFQDTGEAMLVVEENNEGGWSVK